MRRKLIARLLPAVLAMSSVTVRAQAVDDEHVFDARLVGYEAANETSPAGPIVIKPPSGTAGTWFITAILGAMCFGVMCKNAKRSHLD